MAKNYVCNGAKIECQLCLKPEGTLIVTSNQIKVQGEIFATAKDKEKINLLFEGNCKKSPYQASPCMGVIAPDTWENTADLKIDGNPALLENSTIMCTYGGIPIKITDHLQVNTPSEIQPVAAPVIAPIEDATVVCAEWRDNKNDNVGQDVKTLHQDDEVDKTIKEASAYEKFWLEITTQNVMPGQEVFVNLEDKNASNETPSMLGAIVDDKGKAVVLVNSNIKEKQISQEYNITALPKVTGQFTKGWWSIDRVGKTPITRAVPGMKVYFHIETTIPDGEKVLVELYEDDNNEKEETGTGDKDEYQALVNTVTKKASTHKVVHKGKIVKAIILNNFESAIHEDVDKQIELYFRCSHNGEKVALPHKSEDYLVVGTIVIDRYKMPGLNSDGSDIAEDLTYGTGYSQGGKIYKDGQVPKFIKAYKAGGFNEEKHGLFTNKEDLPAVVPAITKPEETEDTVEATPDRFSLIIEEHKKEAIDNTYQFIPRRHVDIYKESEISAKLATRNLKARYSRKEIEELGSLMDYITAKVPEWSLWVDFKIMQESMVWGELNTVLDQMIAKFKSNTGGIFESVALTNSIKKNASTQRYCMYVENYIAEKIKQETLKNVAGIEDKSPDFDTKQSKDLRRRKLKIKGNDIMDGDGSLVTFTRPSFAYKNNSNLLEGRTLALNDIWATEIKLKELKNDGENYTAKYEVTLWDNFGLDKPDMEKFFYYGAGFRAWFVLQHLYGYKPFVTKMTFEKEFKGNICEGREERRAKQKAKEQALIQAEKDRVQKRAWDKATNPFPIGSKL